MTDVNVSVSGIVMCCDDSFAGINLGRGYTIVKKYYEDLPFKSSITTGKGSLSTDYYGSRLKDQNGYYFMIIQKDEVFQINGSTIDGTGVAITRENLFCEDELSAYVDGEMQYLYQQMNLLRLYKEGNIGFVDVFFTFRYKAFDFIDNTINHTSHNKTRNTVDSRRFTLSPSELITCNQFIREYDGAPYAMIKDCIDEFSWGMEQIEPSTGFEQYTTALEMMLLSKNEEGKKQRLANRVAALTGNSHAEIQRVHQRMLDFYRFRSESLHEGDDSNITEAELHEMEDIVRRVLVETLKRCKRELSINPNTTWAIVKAAFINELKTNVSLLKGQGVLPA